MQHNIQLKVTQATLDKLKELKNLFHLSIDEINKLALNYAYEYSSRWKKQINTYNLEEESYTKLLSLNINNDLENQLEELDSNYNDIFQTGIELLYEQNMIYSKKDYTNLIALGCSLISIIFYLFLIYSYLYT